MPTARAEPLNTEAAIFARLWDGGLTAPLARQVLQLGFGATDLARIRALTERHRAGRLTASEVEELDNFVRVGDLLAILQSKARRLLKTPPSGRNGHG